MKNKLTYPLLLGLLGISIVFLLITINKKKKAVSKNKNIMENISAYKFDAYMDWERKTKGLHITDQKVFVGQDSLNAVSLSEFNKMENLYFYFSDKTCPPCILSAIDLLKKYYPDFENNKNLVIISPDYPKRLRHDCYGKQLLTLRDSLLGIDLEKMNVPFFIKLDSLLMISSVHVVDKSDFSKTDVFLKQNAE